jgi:signal transduction histidine kinase
MGKWARKDGSEITVLISISPVDPRDRSSPVVFSVMDITGQEAQKAGLLENELLMRSFVDAIPGPAFLVGEGGEIVTANRAFWERHGKGAGCPPGTPITSLIDKETVQAIMDRVDDALRLGKRSRFEMAHSSSLLLVDICPVCDSQGVFSRAAVFCVDITDHKRAQETLAQYNRKLSLLCRVTRHDAGPLLAALRSYLDLMEKQTEDPLVHTYIHKEERNLDALENVLALAGDCQATGMQPPIWQDVSNVIRKVAGMHDLRNVTIYLDCSGLVVLADPLLEKVFSVLIQNSLQHGGGVTRVSFSYRKEGDGVVLVCEDDGAGIAHDRKEVIFEGEEGENNGSGLFFAREILSMAGFSIRETGNPGEGARFEIGIPRGSFRVGTGGEGGTE